MFGGNFAPLGWAFCNGQVLAISQYDALFALIGTTYGGDGVQTFGLPDLQGRLPVHQGQGPGLTNRIIGQKAGEEQVTVTVAQLPVHTHPANCSSQGAAASPVSKVWATDPGGNIAPYSTAAPNGQMNGAAIANSGGSQGHDNMHPFQVVSFIIALEGIFPSQS